MVGTAHRSQACVDCVHLSTSILPTRKERRGARLATLRVRAYLSQHRPASRTQLRAQKSEIAALVGAEDLLRVQLGIAALRLGLHPGSFSSATRELALLHHEIDAPLLDREPNAVAIAHQGKRPA